MPIRLAKKNRKSGNIKNWWKCRVSNTYLESNLAISVRNVYILQSRILLLNIFLSETWASTEHVFGTRTWMPITASFIIADIGKNGESHDIFIL